MDRSMKQGSSRLSAAEWEALLARIQSPSKELEASLAKSNSNLIEALSGLEELEKLTQTHLAPHLAPPAPELPLAPSAPFAPAHATHAQGSGPQVNSSVHAAQLPAQPQVKYQTSHEEYAPALNQSALVEALLQYQRKKALRSPKPAANAGAPRSKSAPDINTPAFSRSEFIPMKVPAIDAEPKASPLGRSAAPGVRLPVLRLKPENQNANSSGNSDDDEV